VALLAVVEICLLVCLTLRSRRHIQNLCGFPTPTAMGQSFIITLYKQEFFFASSRNLVVSKSRNCPETCPGPAKSRDFEFTSISVGMCYQNSVKCQCKFCAWLVKKNLFTITYKLFIPISIWRFFGNKF
jgi:hypothetical protein